MPCRGLSYVIPTDELPTLEELDARDPSVRSDTIYRLAVDPEDGASSDSQADADVHMPDRGDGVDFSAVGPRTVGLSSKG